MKSSNFLLIILFSSISLTGSSGSFDFFDFDDPIFDQAIEGKIACDTTTTNIEALAALLTLLEVTGILDILDEDFYLRTNELNKRSILDMPLFSTQWFPECTPILTIYPFFNHMPRAYFTSKRDEISSYLAVGPGEFLNSLLNVLDGLEQFLPADIEINTEQVMEIFSLFENFSVEQRRVGFLFKTRFCLSGWLTTIMLPIIWNERNYIVDCPVQRALQEILDPFFGTPASTEQNAFQRQFFVADALGLGDTRIEAFHPIYETEWSKLIFGPMFTLPTSHIWSTGLYGSFFSRTAPRQIIDLNAIALAATSRGEDIDDAQATGQAFALGAINALSAVLLDATVGNKHHIGVGAVMRTYTHLSKFINRPWAEPFQLFGRTSLEYLFPKVSRIAFTVKNTRPFENFEFDADNPEDVLAAAALVEQTITDRFYPYQLLATIYPGFIFRSANQCMYRSEKWSAFVGTDTYIQTAPTFDNIRASTDLRLQLDTKKAAMPWVYQSKAMVGIGYRLDRPDRTWILGVQAETTYLSRGLGKDSVITLFANILF